MLGKGIIVPHLSDNGTVAYESYEYIILHSFYPELGWLRIEIFYREALNLIFLHLFINIHMKS